jgi:DNA-binding transcriptional LysR family regulator
VSKHFTLKQFRYFLAVCDAGSIAAAARLVNIAQSALTKSIQELETTLGTPLFERLPRGMELTQSGYRFEAKARQVISAVMQAGAVNHDEKDELTGSLTIGVTSLMAGYCLADLVARFQRSYPGVRVDILEDSPPFLEHLLINGEVDIALMVANALDERALQVETLSTSPNRVWMSSNHPLAEHGELTLALCADTPLIVLEADRIEDMQRALWRKQGLTPDVKLRTSSLEAVRSLVGVGAGISILPDFLYRRWTLDAERIEVRKLRDAIPGTDIGLVRRRGARNRDVIDQFIQLARNPVSNARR